jgi:elongation factor P
MYTASDLRKGLKVQIDGDPYIVTDFEFSKPGKGQALYRTRLKNMITGNAFERTFRSNDKFEKPDLEERKMQYLYGQGDEFNFMDTSTFEQIVISRQQLEDSVNFLLENMEVDVLMFKGRPIGVTLPNSVVLTVTVSAPWAKGDTSGTDTKPVTVETGYELQVPPFINEGDRLQIDTRTGAYITRVKG